jgi:hypothetical protein
MSRGKLFFTFIERNPRMSVPGYMRSILLVLFMVTVVAGLGQSIPNKGSSTVSADAVITANAAKLSAELSNSRQALSLHVYSGQAWLNTYLWAARDKRLGQAEKISLLDSLATASRQFIAGQWQYHLLLFLQSGKKDSMALQDALLLSDNKAAVYPYLVQYAIIKKDAGQLEKYTAAFNALQPLTATLYQYHFNALMSVGKNGTVYARGLNDLVPMAVLQQQFNIRRDIRLRYYNDTISATENSYLCLSLGKEVLDKYPLASYTGLMVKLDKGEKSVDELLDHVNDFDLSALQNDVWAGEETALYKNYLPGFILLYNRYRADKPGWSVTMYQMILRIARQAGIEQPVLKMLAR